VPYEILVSCRANFAETRAGIMIFDDRASRRGKIPPTGSFQAATAAISSVNPTMFSTRRRL
jgi:hypothetical protein